jgi:hypothetical protein
VRRLVRESIRAIVTEEPACVAHIGAVIVRWRLVPPVPCKRLRLAQVLPLVRAALERASAKCARHHPPSD